MKLEDAGQGTIIRRMPLTSNAMLAFQRLTGSVTRAIAYITTRIVYRYISPHGSS